MIAGAGIGGMVAAAALAQRGWLVTLVDRSSRLDEVSAGIAIWPRAMAVLNRLGVTEGLRGDTMSAGRGAFSLPDGASCAIPASRVRTPTMVHRARLHEEIRNSIQRRCAAGAVDLRLGTSVADARNEDDRAVLITADGQEFGADLVIGADGLRSVVRRSIGGPAETDRVRYAGYTAFRGISALTDLDAADPDIAIGGEVFGYGLRFGYVPLVDHRTYWYATVTAPEASTDRNVLDRFDGWHDPVPKLISSTPPEAILHNDMYDLNLPLPSFASGRIALLGDAAHAMTPNLGQGACSAIEDAATLAQLLDESDVPGAIRAYDRRRRPITERLVRLSRLVGDLGHTRRRAVVVPRDALLRVGAALTRSSGAVDLRLRSSRVRSGRDA